jgi:hypothetical protein
MTANTQRNPNHEAALRLHRREPQELEGGNRKTKLALIENSNPDWTDLYPAITG